VAEEDALGQPRRAGRVEGRGAGILVKVEKIEVPRTLRQQFFVFRRNLNGGRRTLSNTASIT
jgi:hypothetical protein